MRAWFSLAAMKRPATRSGMSFFKADADAFTVPIMLSNSPASEVGIVASDKIVSVGGKRARLLSGWDLRHILRRPIGTKLMLGVIHAGRKSSVSLTLREMLP
jgi:C-terminal processing protease CtpA/Prc